MDANFVRKIRGLQADSDTIFERTDFDCGIYTQHLHVAARARPQTFENFYCRGLPCSVGPKQAKNLALAHLEIDPADRFYRTVGLEKSTDLNCMFHERISFYEFAIARGKKDRRM